MTGITTTSSSVTANSTGATIASSNTRKSYVVSDEEFLERVAAMNCENQQRTHNKQAGPGATKKEGAALPVERSAILVRADALTPESISWAWPNRFAFGKMAMIAGDPGLGKSTILVDIAAHHSTGSDFPCGEGKAVLCEVLFLTAEDGLRDTLVPRLMAAEANLTKVHFLTGTRATGAAADDSAMFDITRDITVLRKVFTDNPAIKVLIIDPLTAYLGAGAKAKENTDVRRVLTPLVKLAEEFGVLLLANNHLNKNGGKALYRILDSIAFAALGRTIHLVATDLDNPDNRKFICDKSNIGSKPLGLTYIIQKCWIKGEQGEEIETSRISWGTKHIDETADEALSPDTGSGTAKGEAIEFLHTVLANGRIKVLDIEAEARNACLLGKDKELKQSKPFRDAKDELRIVSSREGFGPGAIWYWSLPQSTPAPNSDIGAHRSPQASSSKNRAPMDTEGAYDENKGDEGANGEAEFHHRRPQPSLVPSQGMRKQEGPYGERAPNGGDGHSGQQHEPVRCLQCGEPIGPGSREITVRSTGTGLTAPVHQDCLDEWQRRGPSQ